MATGKKDHAIILQQLGKEEPIVSGTLILHDRNKQKGKSVNENNTSDASNIGQGEYYAVGDICMISQTDRCKQFHPTSITQIVDNNISIRYLTTKVSDIIPMVSQVKALDQVGRGKKRSRVRTLSISLSDKQLPNVNNTEQECSTIQVCTTDNNTNNKTNNIYCGKSSLYKISLER